MFTLNQSRILAILSENPQKEFFLQELGRLIGKKPGVFQRGLNSLEQQGLVVSRRQGTLRLFKINGSHPLYNEFRSIAKRTVGIEAELKNVLENIGPIKVAAIYGSYAKDSMRPDSDVDLLIIAEGPQVEDELVKALARSEKTFRREINYKFYTEKDFKKRLDKKDPFLSSILSDKKIMLKGAL
jgi:predicted nucleotidyltransferase